MTLEIPKAGGRGGEGGLFCGGVVSHFNLLRREVPFLAPLYVRPCFSRRTDYWYELPLMPLVMPSDWNNCTPISMPFPWYCLVELYHVKGESTQKENPGVKWTYTFRLCSLFQQTLTSGLYYFIRHKWEGKSAKVTHNLHQINWFAIVFHRLDIRMLQYTPLFPSRDWILFTSSSHTYRRLYYCTE